MKDNTPPNDGFSIAKFTGDDSIDNCTFTDSITKIGSVVIGTYYDMPHSPDLKLTMTREMDGVKRIRTRGGSDLVNRKYTKPPLWGNGLAPWEIAYTHGIFDPGNQELSRVGRRIWDLSFSYLQGSDIFGPFPYLGIPYPETNTYMYVPTYGMPNDDDYESGSDLSHTTDGIVVGYNSNLLTDDNFFSQVIHRTNGGQLPFIFNPAGGGSDPDNSPQNFAICKLDMNAFKFEQVAKGIYNVKLKIREVW